ncbi:MAG: hypothetical protein M1272_03075 [Firmicutes bacterium]|nr:hypothetical protein [Bacillota bacterium]
MILPAEVQASVKEFLGTMVDPVTVKLYAKAGEESSETMRSLWQELAGLSEKLVLDVRDEVPANMTSASMEGAVTELWADGAFTGIRYLGLPAGHEFGPLVQTLVDLSTHVEPEVSSETAAWLKGLEQELRLQVFVTPT